MIAAKGYHAVTFRRRKSFPSVPGVTRKMCRRPFPLSGIALQLIGICFFMGDVEPGLGIGSEGVWLREGLSQKLLRDKSGDFRWRQDRKS